jgi:hypothetical protein
VRPFDAFGFTVFQLKNSRIAYRFAKSNPIKIMMASLRPLAQDEFRLRPLRQPDSTLANVVLCPYGMCIVMERLVFMARVCA